MGKLLYFPVGVFPLYLGFCTDPKAFAKEVRRLKIGEDVPFLGRPNANATAHIFTKGAAITGIICIDPKGATPEQIAALLAHEAVHIAQELWRAIGEQQPGDEAEAYLVQYIVQSCLVALKDERKRRK